MAEISLEEKLTLLVNDFGKKSDEYTRIKKEFDEDKEYLKAVLNSMDKDSAETSEYKVSVSKSNREKMNEAKLLKVLLKTDFAREVGLIKTVEVVDFDRLEEMLYQNEIPSDTMEEIGKCREVTEVVTLRCKAKKG